jgi:hypothetical protein
VIGLQGARKFGDVVHPLSLSESGLDIFLVVFPSLERLMEESCSPCNLRRCQFPHIGGMHQLQSIANERFSMDNRMSGVGFDLLETLHVDDPIVEMAKGYRSKIYFGRRYRSLAEKATKAFKSFRPV